MKWTHQQLELRSRQMAECELTFCNNTETSNHCAKHEKSLLFLFHQHSFTQLIQDRLYNKSSAARKVTARWIITGRLMNKSHKMAA